MTVLDVGKWISNVMGWERLLMDTFELKCQVGVVREGGGQVL